MSECKFLDFTVPSTKSAQIEQREHRDRNIPPPPPYTPHTLIQHSLRFRLNEVVHDFVHIVLTLLLLLLLLLLLRPEQPLKGLEREGLPGLLLPVLASLLRLLGLLVLLAVSVQTALHADGVPELAVLLLLGVHFPGNGRPGVAPDASLLQLLAVDADDVAVLVVLSLSVEDRRTAGNERSSAVSRKLS